MKDYDKSKEPSYHQYLGRNLYGKAISQNLPVGGFKWIRNQSKFNKYFIKNYEEDSDIRYFLEADVQ